jgi:hypothetical protein
MSCATPILLSGPLGHVPETAGHVAEIAGHDPETAGHLHPKYALSRLDGPPLAALERIANTGLGMHDGKFLGHFIRHVPKLELRISPQAGQGFRGKLDRLFTRSWTRISRQAGQRFRAKLDSKFVK